MFLGFNYGLKESTFYYPEQNTLTSFLPDNETSEGLFETIQAKLKSRNVSNEKVYVFELRSENSPILERIPNELIAVFPRLRELEISSHNFQEFAANDMACTIELQNLTVKHSQKLKKLSAGTIPSAKWKFLDLKENAIETIEEFTFSNLIILEHLILEKNQLTEINRNTFAGLSMLKVLNLYGNDIHTIDDGAFSDQKRLERLVLDENRLKMLGAHTFDGLSSLKILLMVNSQIERIGNSLYGLNNLKSVWLNKNPIQDIDLMEFAKLPNLESLYIQATRLDLKNCTVSPEFLSTSPLKTLNLAFNNLTRKDLDVLRIFPNLTRLNVAGNNIYEPEEGVHTTMKQRSEAIRGRVMEILPNIRANSITTN